MLSDSFFFLLVFKKLFFILSVYECECMFVNVYIIVQNIRFLKPVSHHSSCNCFPLFTIWKMFLVEYNIIFMKMIGNILWFQIKDLILHTDFVSVYVIIIIFCIAGVNGLFFAFLPMWKKILPCNTRSVKIISDKWLVFFW